MDTVAGIIFLLIVGAIIDHIINESRYADEAKKKIDSDNNYHT